MTIEFSYNHRERYLYAKYVGKFQPGDLGREWGNFYGKGYKRMGYNALVDLSETDLTAVPMKEVEALSEAADRFYKANGITALKVAYYAPDDLSYGLARAYEGMSVHTVEITRTFRDLEAAKAWLTSEDEE